MGWNIKKAKQSGGGNVDGFMKTKTIADYPTVIIHSARVGEKQNFDKTGMNDYIVGDFIGLDKDFKVVMREFNNLWEINRRKDGQPGALFSALAEASVYIGSIGKPAGKPYYVWTDKADEFFDFDIEGNATVKDEYKSLMDSVMTYFDANGTKEEMTDFDANGTKEEMPVIGAKSAPVQDKKPWEK